ncbi:lysozyme [Cronobacter sakazakii]|uniref:lysozyme n=1 Tax=Cronobacter sakazakii TaxID=28141 RepID=UPI0015D9332D|nr:lysozyme [Cronobacter sakazakii]ELY3601902.1 lysozyme [Cronobacter sakazakii]QLJ52041.1 lysozyme [Cronobacter sakazakii]
MPYIRVARNHHFRLVASAKDGVEGRKYQAYKDVAGVWTVCDGHTGNDIIRGKTYTDKECDRLLWKDLQPAKATVDKLVKVPLSEYQRASLYSFVFNVGSDAFAKSTLLRKLNKGDQEGACEEMRRWVYAGGMKWKGLQNRREMERSMCLAESENDL